MQLSSGGDQMSKGFDHRALSDFVSDSLFHLAGYRPNDYRPSRGNAELPSHIVDAATFCARVKREEGLALGRSQRTADRK